MRLPDVLKPDWPPSPPITWVQVVPSKAQLPLSCVPASSVPRGSLGSNDRPRYCRVASPSFSGMISRGIELSQSWQLARSAPVRLRKPGPQVCEVSTNVPSVRTRPPSEPMNATFGCSGANTIACWSGCMPLGTGPRESFVISVKLAPASVERITARPLDRVTARKMSGYRIAPPTQTVLGRPRGDATNMSYEHWLAPPILQKSNRPKPGVPLVGLVSSNQPVLPAAPVNWLAGTLALSVR